HVGRRLYETVAVGVQGGDPAPALRGHLVEVVGRVGAADGVGAVHAVVLGHRHPAQPARVAEVPGLLRRGEDAALLGDGDVGPPVGGHRPVVRVADAD